MCPQNVTYKQQIQEDEYLFPYHFLDLIPKFSYTYRLIQSYRKLVCDLIAPYQGQNVLDAGCGDGRLCYDLAEKNVIIEGVDYSEKAISFANVFCPNVKFYVCDLTKESPIRKYNIIILMEVLEHFKPSTTKQVLISLNNCLADDGKLIITVPSIRSKLIPKHYQHFTVNSLKETIGEHFEVISIVGHLRSGLRLFLCKLLLKGNYVLGPLRMKSSIVRLYYRLIEYLLASIETCQAEKAARLIAVCKKIS